MGLSMYHIQTDTLCVLTVFANWTVSVLVAKQHSLVITAYFSANSQTAETLAFCLI